MSFNASFKIFLFLGCYLLGFVELKPVAKWDSNAAEPLILVRLKRTPSRAFTFSGFNPSTGLSAFATSADFLPSSYYRYVPLPASPPSPPSPPSSNYAAPVPQQQGQGHEDTSYLPSGESDSSYDYAPSVEFPSSSLNVGEDDRKIPAPSQNLTPPASESTPVTGYGSNAIPIPPTPAKKPKKKPNRVNPAPTPIDEEEEDAEENVGKSRSSSSASFNAWFPIVLGSYPSRPNPESFKEAEGNSSPLKERQGSTVIANSVSNGRSGVASSHAVLYGGEAPVQNYRRG
ncbi:uncharacterized protein LOC135846211 [Planococcus citri]|uniref:uncharacterized protein LOC135846211 n=1 Tax=Planococcus citri TaxID=170843 RepID=UPI0031F8AB16